MCISYGNDYEYADRCLRDTVVKKEKSLVKIIEITLGGDVFYVPIKRGRQNTCKLEDLDLSPIKLGYVNKGGNSFYLHRLPLRQWKQGLTNRLVRSSNNRQFGVVPELVMCAFNTYPTIEECIEEIKQFRTIKHAFSRRFALSVEDHGDPGRISLEYKGTVVGHLHNQQKNVRVNWLPGQEIYIQQFERDTENV